MKSPKFKSFFMAGFECTYALAENGRRFDLLSASRHDDLISEDYQMIKKAGILTAREGLSWSQIDKGGGVYDFSRFEPMMAAAKAAGIQQIWDLNHFDFPEDLDPFSPNFPKRFGEYAKRALEIFRKYQKGMLYICPINEPSFFAWMCDEGKWAPYGKGRGDEFKMQLARASLTAMKAIWSLDRNVRFVHCDPFMHRQPLRKTSVREQKFCENFNGKVRFHFWDMIAGLVNPELGGEPEYLDIIGVNYYFHNQQQVRIDGEPGKQKFSFRSMPLKGPLRLSLSGLLMQVYERYRVPMILSETGSHGQKRPAWWRHIYGGVKEVLETKMPLCGVCSYPTLDVKRGAGFVFPQSGLWDFKANDPLCRRVPHKPTLSIIKQFRNL